MDHTVLGEISSGKFMTRLCWKDSSNHFSHLAFPRQVRYGGNVRRCSYVFQFPTGESRYDGSVFLNPLIVRLDQRFLPLTSPRQVRYGGNVRRRFCLFQFPTGDLVFDESRC